MKMKYVKPLISIERFGLTQSIAQYCQPRDVSAGWGYANWTTKETCAWITASEQQIFVQGMACSGIFAVENPDDEVEGFCYNNSDGGVNIFGSY